MLLVARRLGCCYLFRLSRRGRWRSHVVGQHPNFPIIERVSEHFQSDLETLRKRGTRGNLARRCAITLCWDHAGLSHDEIAALFQMPSSNSVAQAIRRAKAHDAQTLKVLNNQISHNKFEIPAYRSVPGSFATWAASFVQTLETGNRKLSREKLESFLTASCNPCLKRAI